jgi:hypothetical protein
MCIESMTSIIHFSKFYLFDDLTKKSNRLICHVDYQLPHNIEHYSNYKQVRTYVRKYS